MVEISCVERFMEKFHSGEDLTGGRKRKCACSVDFSNEFAANLPMISPQWKPAFKDFRLFSKKNMTDIKQNKLLKILNITKIRF